MSSPWEPLAKCVASSEVRKVLSGELQWVVQCLSQRGNVASVGAEVGVPGVEVRDASRGAEVKLEVQRVEVVDEIDGLVPGKLALVDLRADVGRQCSQEHALDFLLGHGLGLRRG